MKTIISLLSLALFLPMFAAAQMQPVTIKFDYIATNVYQAPHCATEGEASEPGALGGLACQVSVNGTSVMTNSDDEWPVEHCTTVDYQGPIYHFPGPAGPYCGAPVNEGIGTATFVVPPGVAVYDANGNLVGATNSGGTVVVKTAGPLYRQNWPYLAELHFVNVTYTPGTVPGGTTPGSVARLQLPVPKALRQ